MTKALMTKETKEFDIRGKLASLAFWHRLPGADADELVSFIATLSAQPAQVPVCRMLTNDEIRSVLDAEDCDFCNGRSAINKFCQVNGLTLAEAYYNTAELQRGFDRYEKLRSLNPRQFSELHKANLLGQRFDDLVDALSAPTPKDPPL
jgi:hypothetical protein